MAYNLHPREFSPETVDKVVTLRKNYSTLEKISEEVGLSAYHVERILKEELGVEYSKYRWKRWNFTQENIKQIIELRKQRIRLKEISESMDIPEPTVIEILKRELKEECHFYTRRVTFIPERLLD